MYETARNYSMEEITEIAQKVAKGDLGINDLVEANIKNVLHLTLKYRNNPHYEDIVQNALVAIAECDIKKALKPTAFIASLVLDSARKTISHSRCVTRSHQTKIDTESYDLVFKEYDDTCTAPDFESVDVDELRKKIGLTELETHMLELREQGYTLQEISDRIEVPLSTISHRFKHIIPAKAKELFRNEL